jgi:tRNA modification GTPase
MSGDTIFALATPRGRSAVAIVRISGPGIRFGLEMLVGAVPEARKAALRRIVDPNSGEILDQAIVIWFPAPASFTGEDMAELHLHGSRAVLEGVVGALSGLGFRAAEAGEFTRRAFSNGKSDLTAIEGLADLIDAQTASQRRQAMRQMAGDLAVLADRWRSVLLAAMAALEAYIDFSDEGDVIAAGDTGLGQLQRELQPIALEMDRLLAGSRRSERLREGVVAVLAGPPNSGKSTLLNALAGRDVAIVSDRPGTTRDVLEVALDLGGTPLTIIDTAGLHESSDDIEREGIRRARARLATADIVLWLTPADAPAECHEAGDAGCVIQIATKIDSLSKPFDDARLPLSAHTGVGLDSLVQQLEDAAELLAGEGSLLTRERHRRALEQARGSLQDVLVGLEPDRLELAAEDLRLAVRALESLVGRVDVEEVLDELFAGFCIGK